MSLIRVSDIFWIGAFFFLLFVIAQVRKAKSR